MKSPNKCVKCGKPANSPLPKKYCWDCYYRHTNGHVFEGTDGKIYDGRTGKESEANHEPRG